MIVYFIKSVLGPELYRAYKQPGQSLGKSYIANGLEFYSSSFITFFHGFCTFCKWTSPALLAFAYSRGYLSVEGLYSLCRFAFVFGGFLVTAYIARGIGRSLNIEYRTFIDKYQEVNKRTKELALERRQFLAQYDFEMKNWQPDFVPTSKPPEFKENEPLRFFYNSIFDSIKFVSWRFLSALCVDTFGLRMMYPGVIIQNLIGKALVDGRGKFIESKRAQRAIVQTFDSYKNKIDTLFVDQRNVVHYKGPSSRSNFATLDNFDTNNNGSSRESNGNTLVICCDGNASFYEVGCFQIPIENGYSTLGWNYPGFGESTGLPYPVQLTAAADAIMEYAFSLGFKSENIVLFSWSIGGFAVSWLSNQYPDVKAVILDACFDDITPLAQQQMPKFATDFVEFAIRNHLNLNVTKLISRYNGPVMFIRRTQDEIISTIPRMASTNRGNDLLLSTLRTRYPFIVNDETIPYIRTWLSAKSELDRTRILSSYSSDLVKCESILANYVRLHSNRYPLTIGKELSGEDVDLADYEDSFNLSRDLKLTLALYLADKYLRNFESSHCQPLPREFCCQPWSEHELLLKGKCL